jgi:carbamate kinase
METIVIALGGNAILQSGQRGTTEEQFVNVDMTARQIARIVGSGYRVVVAHVNGP